MSLYQFFASEKEMPELDNMNAKTISIDGEIIAITINSSFDEITAMRINKEDDLYYASQFTDKKHVNYIEWYYNDDNAKVIIEYIRVLLKDRYTVSLFNTWMDDKSKVLIKKKNIADLTIQDVKHIWGQEFFKQNECLVVYKKCLDD